jgi:hypothetical protein
MRRVAFLIRGKAWAFALVTLLSLAVLATMLFLPQLLFGQQQQRNSIRWFGKQEAEARLPLVKKIPADDEIVVDSDRQELVWVGDGHGGIKYSYWIIHFRDNTNTCLSLNEIKAQKFGKEDLKEFCGQAPDTKIFQPTHIKNSDILQ